MHPKTKEIYDALVDTALTGSTTITANVFTHCFSRSHVAPAIRKAKKDGIIEIRTQSIVGNPIYQPGPAIAAILEERKQASVN